MNPEKFRKKSPYVLVKKQDQRKVKHWSRFAYAYKYKILLEYVYLRGVAAYNYFRSGAYYYVNTEALVHIY